MTPPPYNPLDRLRAGRAVASYRQGLFQHFTGWAGTVSHWLGYDCLSLAGLGLSLAVLRLSLVG